MGISKVERMGIEGRAAVDASDFVRDILSDGGDVKYLEVTLQGEVERDKEEPDQCLHVQGTIYVGGTFGARKDLDLAIVLYNAAYLAAIKREIERLS